MAENSANSNKPMGAFGKFMVILGGISGFLALLVAIKVSLLQLLPADIVNATNARLAKFAEAVFNTDCDLTGKWQCAKGCAGPTKIVRTSGGYRFYNENNSAAAVISLGPRELFAPRWADNLGGLFISVTADCRRLDADNGTAWSFVSK
jgi:hypothetical protein